MTGSKTTKKSKQSSDQASFGRVSGLIWKFMGGERRMFILAFFMLVIEQITAVILPLVLAYVINYMAARLAQLDGKAISPPLSPLGALFLPNIINPDIDTLVIVSIGIILLTVINSLGDSLAEIYLARGGRKLGYNLRLSLYAQLQKLSLAFHDQRRTGDILTRITADVAALEEFIVGDVSDFVGSVLLIIFILVAIFINAWQVALVAAVVIPVMAVISSYFTTRIKAASRRWRTSEGELTSATQEMLASIRVIQTYGLGSYEQSMFSDQNQKALEASLEAAKLQAQFSWIVSVLGSFSTAAVIWMGVWLIFHNPLTLVGIGLLTAYVKYIQDMFKPTKRIIAEWNAFGRLSVRVERIGDLLDLKPEVEDLPGALAAPAFKGRVEFRNVNFTYRPVSTEQGGSDLTPRQALKNVNFVIEPGEVVAVVGHTGAGKSTIVQLIPRLYDPTSGQILIDDQDIRNVKLDSLRSQISMVLQESILFSGSVVENIAYGRTDATGAEIIAAAKQANAHEFLEKLPEGYYTLLGERGSNLSGGQRQRIAIARAFVRKTSILILDEPTTGLDAESSELVLGALQTLMKGKTTIIISHDLNLIRNADKIIVINHGEVEQIGSHDELMRAGGLYATLYQKQSGQGQIEPELAALNLIAPEAEPVSAKPAPKKREIVLARHPALLNRLPALGQAFDVDVMKDRLVEALFDGGSSQYEVERLTPRKAIYLPENGSALQYLLELKDKSSGEHLSSVINARLFDNLSSSQAYYQERLVPLAEQARNRPDLAKYKTPAFLLKDLQMVGSVFPIDATLPGLIEITDEDRMRKIFNETLPEVLSGQMLIGDIHYELVHYGRYERCVIRYTLEGRRTDTGAPQNLTIYGKVDAGGSGGLTVPVLAALREKVHDQNQPEYFDIPRSIAYFSNLKLLLMEALPGSTIMKTLYQGWPPSQRHAGISGDVTLEEAIQSSASIAATLHTSGIKFGRRQTIIDEIECLQEDLRLLTQLFPDLGGQLHGWLDDVSKFAKQSSPLPLCFNHGDFKYSQLIFNGSSSGLIDYDGVCQAEPASDLGNFLAYQRMALKGDGKSSSDPTGQLHELFLKSYIYANQNEQIDEAGLRARVRAYEMIGLIRMVAHDWEKLKGQQLLQTLLTIKELMPNITR
jgi:ABC-type multidrug transport system fused ATPase/permease subunit